MFFCAQSNHLIVDTGAIIQGTRLERLGKELWTIPEVLEETRDAKARAFLSTLPVPLKLRTPTPEDVKAVADFARKTGDYATLSVTDIKVLALAYMFEREHNGVEHIRTEPKAKTFGPNARVRWAQPKPKKNRRKRRGNQESQEDWPEDEGEHAHQEGDIPHDEVESAKNESEENSDRLEKAQSSDESKSNEEKEPQQKPTVVEKPPSESPTQAQESTESHSETTAEKKADSSESEKVVEQEKKEGEHKEEGSESKEQQQPETPTQPEGQKKKKKKKNRGRKRNRRRPNPEGSQTGGEGQAQQPNLLPKESDWGGGWITPENVKNFSNVDGSIPDQEIKVACITTDYSMQNVLLQMGLKLLSVDGFVIKRLTQYLNRCSACFHITMEMDREFCPKCGNHTLQRIAYSVDDEGTVILHPSRFKQPKLRGTIYSIPKYQGGRRSNNIVLREDEVPYRRRRKEQDLFDPDYDFLTPRRNMDQKGFVFGYGRKNPNEAKRRTGKKKKNSGTLN